MKRKGLLGAPRSDDGLAGGAAAEKRAVRGVDDGVGIHFCDVAVLSDMDARSHCFAKRI